MRAQEFEADLAVGSAHQEYSFSSVTLDVLSVYYDLCHPIPDLRQCGYNVIVMVLL